MFIKHSQEIAANHGNIVSTQLTKHHAREWTEVKMVSNNNVSKVLPYNWKDGIATKSVSGGEEQRPS